MKCNIRKYTIKFSKELAKNINKIDDFETKLRHYEKRENCVDNLHYKVCKQQLDEIYEKKAKSIKIRSKCNWYEHGEKTSCNPKSNIVIINQDEITDQDEINTQILSLYQSLFSR